MRSIGRSQIQPIAGRSIKICGRREWHLPTGQAGNIAEQNACCRPKKMAIKCIVQLTNFRKR